MVKPVIISDEFYLRIPAGRLSAVIAVDSIIWAMRNGTGKTMRIRWIMLTLGFDGTAASTTASYQFRRFSAATPTGGSPLAAIKKRGAGGDSNLADARYNYAAALSKTGLTEEDPFAEVSCARQLASSNQLWLQPLDDKEQAIELAPGEGLEIRLGAASVVGDNLSGFVRWEEV